MAKQYGLIIPGQKKRNEPPKSDFTKPSIFGESSDSDDDHGPPQLKMKSAPIGPGASEKRIARKLQEKALAEDPTVFQYDELYDDIEGKREEAKKAKSIEVKKPKYIGRLLECAEKRKLENERRIERMVQKERELEGEEFKGKESFVTSAYRKKLEEMQKAEEQEKREEYLEAIGDVTKQKDLDGFYRHLYEQKLGPKEGKKVAVEEAPSTSKESEEIAYKPIKSGKPRTYRKRRSSAEEETETDRTATDPAKRAHIQSNLDADSDFSIDSSSSDEENDSKKKKNGDMDKDKAVEKAAEQSIIKKEPGVQEGEQTFLKPATDASVAASPDIKLDIIKKEKEDGEVKPTVDMPPPQPKKDKTLIWKKRTVGAVFDAALQRYFQRKAARNG